MSPARGDRDAPNIGGVLWLLRRLFAVIAQSNITCPQCNAATLETMPSDACQFFYECPGCGMLLRPKPGDCCVFCSYGSVRGPPVQKIRKSL